MPVSEPTEIVAMTLVARNLSFHVGGQKHMRQHESCREDHKESSCHLNGHFHFCQTLWRFFEHDKKSDFDAVIGISQIVPNVINASILAEKYFYWLTDFKSASVDCQRMYAEFVIDIRSLLTALYKPKKDACLTCLISVLFKKFISTEEKISEVRDSNLGQLVEKSKRYLCALLTPGLEFSPQLLLQMFLNKCRKQIIGKKIPADTFSSFFFLECNKGRFLMKSSGKKRRRKKRESS